VGIWRICGVPLVICDGTGEDNRAIDAALGIELPEFGPLKDPEFGEPAVIGTGRGREDEASSLGDDMMVWVRGSSEVTVVGQKLFEGLSHYRIGLPWKKTTINL
jgi:hypothetical protein